MNRGQPVLLVHSAAKRDSGRQAQYANTQAGKTVADIIRTTLGPQSMLKMLLDPMGGIVLTNDGNAILREVDVAHPGAKTMIELSRAQDEEVGDGTTSVVLIAGEILSLCEPLLDKNILPTQIVAGLLKALDDSLQILDDMSTTLNIKDSERIIDVLQSCLTTKSSARYSKIIPKLAFEAAKTVTVTLENGKTEVDIKKYAKVEKIPGGLFEDSRVLDGIMLNKDVVHTSMRRLIKNPRVVLLDSSLEYKKGESQTEIEITETDHWEKILQQEENEVKQMCEDIIKVGCDVVVTEKGVSDLAQHFLQKANISVLRRARKTDNNRLAKITGATIVTRTSELRPEDVGHRCKLFVVRKLGDEYYSFFEKCEDPKACTIILRGGSKDVLNELERNFIDAVTVARNLILNPKILPGGGAVEMELASRLFNESSKIQNVIKWPYKAVGMALEVIPRTLIQNCGGNIVRTMTQLRSFHTDPKNQNMGVDGQSGCVIDTFKNNIFDTLAVKEQILKTAVEAASMLIRIDDVLSAVQKPKEETNAPPQEILDS